jgi:hypothetical protein
LIGPIDNATLFCYLVPYGERDERQPNMIAGQGIKPEYLIYFKPVMVETLIPGYYWMPIDGLALWRDYDRTD